MMDWNANLAGCLAVVFMRREVVNVAQVTSILELGKGCTYSVFKISEGQVVQRTARKQNGVRSNASKEQK